jgi:hypothetical protein
MRNIGGRQICCHFSLLCRCRVDGDPLLSSCPLRQTKSGRIGSAICCSMSSTARLACASFCASWAGDQTTDSSRSRSSPSPRACAASTGIRGRGSAAEAKRRSTVLRRAAGRRDADAEPRQGLVRERERGAELAVQPRVAHRRPGAGPAEPARELGGPLGPQIALLTARSDRPRGREGPPRTRIAK